MIEFIKNSSGRVILKVDESTPAHLSHAWIQDKSEKNLTDYLEQEFQMQNSRIQENGYASFYLVNLDSQEVLHARVSGQGHDWLVTYVD